MIFFVAMILLGSVGYLEKLHWVNLRRRVLVALFISFIILSIARFMFSIWKETKDKQALVEYKQALDEDITRKTMVYGGM